MNKVPNLRFKEFSGDWSFSILDSVCTINPRTKELPNDFYYIDLESVHKGMLSDVSIINKTNAPSRAQRLLSAGDILFQTVRPYQKNNYLFKEENGFPTVASTGYAQIRAHQNNKFLYYLLHTSNFNKNVLIRCTGSNYPAINSTDLSEIDICLPSIEEQEKIAFFFSLIDKKIELQTEKVEELKNYKKGIMQKIFSQELRFKDENGNEYPEWENIKLSKILLERKTYAEKDGKYPHVTLSKDGIYDKGERYDRDFLVKTEDKKYKITHKGDICYNPANLKFGVICRNDFGDAIFSPIYVTFEINKNVDSNYMGYYLTRWDFINKVRKYEEGTVYERMAVKPEDFLRFNVDLPNIREQKKISNFLIKIDSKIDYEQQKLELLTSYKKGLLQQMFI